MITQTMPPPLTLEDTYNVEHCIVFVQDVVVEFDGDAK